MPGGIPVVELVPELARELGVLDAGSASHGFRLVAGGGTVVDPDRSLAAQGITDGAVLSLETVDVTTDKVYDDVVEAVADVVETQFAPWTARHSAGTAIGAATVFLLCAAWALFTAREVGPARHRGRRAPSPLLLVGTAAVLESRTQVHGRPGPRVHRARLRGRRRASRRSRRRRCGARGCCTPVPRSPSSASSRPRSSAVTASSSRPAPSSAPRWSWSAPPAGSGACR